MAQLSWRHHTLIQALLSRGPLPEEEFRSIFSGVTGKSPGTHQQFFNDFLLKINKELAYVQFELRGCVNQYTGKVYYGVVNKTADEQSKLGTKYSVPQIAYYKAIIEAITQDVTAQGCISNIDALNIRLENQVLNSEGSQSSQSRVPAALKNFTISQKEKTLNDLISDKWLCSTTNGHIGLGVRSFLDLRSWFVGNDVPSCDVCNEAGVKADMCSNEGCTVRMHSYCLKKKFSQKKIARVCPGCGTAWHLLSVPVVEEEEEEENAAAQSQLENSNLRAKKRLRSWKTEAAVATQSQSKSQSHSPARPDRLRSCKTEAVEAAQQQNNRPGSDDPPLSKRLRSCKAEASSGPARKAAGAGVPYLSIDPCCRRPRTRRP